MANWLHIGEVIKSLRGLPAPEPKVDMLEHVKRRVSVLIRDALKEPLESVYADVYISRREQNLVVVTFRNAGFSMHEDDLDLSMNDISERFLKPFVHAVANRGEVNG